MIRFARALVAALMLMAPPLVAASDASYRYIESYTGPAGAYRIDRGAQKLAPHLGMVLDVGDCVEIIAPHNAQLTDSANRMTLMIDGTEVRVDASSPKYCVAQSGGNANAAAAAIGRMFASIGDLFQRAQNDYYTEHTTTAQTRGGVQEPVTIVLLQPAHPRVAAGARTLSIAWIDGSAPYQAGLYKAGDATPLSLKTGLQQRNASFDVTLQPGPYEIHVSDASGKAAVGAFAAVRPDELPKPPPGEAAALADASQPQDVRAALYAGWLAQQSSDWRLEAYNQVIPFAATSDLARTLSFELAGGD